VREGPWKLIDSDKRPPRLFHLVDDPGEKKNLAREKPEVVERLRAVLTRHMEALPAPPADAGHAPVETQEDAEKLRDLGY
jgi:hypothetical protein